MEADGQVGTFLLMAATGGLLGLVFDFYRIMRGLLRLRWLATAIADAVFWLLAAAAVCTALLFGNWGELRLYVYVGLVAGAAGYYRFVSRRAIRALVWFIRLTARVIRAAGRLTAAAARPLRAGARAAARPARRLDALFSRRPPGDIPPG